MNNNKISSRKQAVLFYMFIIAIFIGVTVFDYLSATDKTGIISKNIISTLSIILGIFLSDLVKGKSKLIKVGVFLGGAVILILFGKTFHSTESAIGMFSGCFLFVNMIISQVNGLYKNK